MAIFKSAFATAGTLAATGVLLGAGSAWAGPQLTCNATNFAGCQGTLGDKTFSGFSLTGLSGYTPDASDIIVIDQISSNAYQIFFTPVSTTQNFSGTLNYSVDITPAGIIAGNTFGVGQANVNGSSLGGSFITSVSSASLLSNATSTNGAGSLVNFNSGVTSATFAQAFAVSGANVLNQTGFTFTQNDFTGVPGPLPILGAGAAFGFSRKLRRRIKEVA